MTRKTPGSESNVKEIFDKCWELRKSGENLQIEWIGDRYVIASAVPSAGGVQIIVRDEFGIPIQVADALDGAGFGRLGVIAGIETALGVADARALLAHDRVVAGYFGAEDFIADMGGVRTSGNAEVHHARAAVALAFPCADAPPFPASYGYADASG